MAKWILLGAALVAIGLAVQRELPALKRELNIMRM